MIQPVNAFTPKVLFRGETVNEEKELVKKETRKKLALANAAGISIVLGAATTAIARSNTSSWRHAGYFGIGAALVSMMFLGPGFLYKSGINTTKPADKLLAEVGDISTAAKTTRAAVKAMPKI